MLYASGVLLISGLVGLHLGRFRRAYTEMTGMMAGMTMGMLNGFLLGYAAAAATNSMFWGNLFGVLLGLSYGAYFGRAGGLMGVMDGAMGGVMGGSMGAMLALMVVFPRDALLWTALLFALIYVAGMVGLVVLIERSSPRHAALHRLLPLFTRAIAREVEEVVEEIEPRLDPASPSVAPIPDYYAFLGITPDASAGQITEACLAALAGAEGEDIRRAELAFATLTDPRRRAAYDRRLQESRSAAGADCCPPPRRRQGMTAVPPLSQPSQQALPAHAHTPSPGPVRVRDRDRGSATADVAVSARPGAHKTPEAGARNRNQNRNQNPPASKPPTPRRGAPTVPAKGRAVARNSNRGRARHEAPISWVGGLAAIFIVVLLIVWWLMGQSTAGGAQRGPVNQVGGQSGQNSGAVNNLIPGYASNPHNLTVEFVRSLESRAVVVPPGPDGRQTLDLLVNGDTMSYEPSVIRVKAGVPVRFNLGTKGRDPG
jgi:hypothetical protein